MSFRVVRVAGALRVTDTFRVFVFFAAVQLRLSVRAGGAAPLIEAVVSIVVAIALVLYYRTLSRWGK